MDVDFSLAVNACEQYFASTIRDCAIIIRRGEPKNELRKEKYYTILPLNKGKFALTPVQISQEL